MPRCPNPRCQTDYPPGTKQCSRPMCRCLLPETVVAGRYRVETLIGMGGMGAVYRVSDTFEVQQIALKILSLTLSTMDADTAVERFRREARYAHQLQHPNIVPVLNFGQDGELLYITMPLITGGTLKALMKPEHPLPTLEAERFLADLAAAIDAIHAHPQQIVHRDIKPSNLLINPDDGRLMVADFGIARAMQEKPLTQRGWALGTENYIAPEQEHGKAEPASDIYSMGVVAYQLFTGLLPYQAVVRNRARGLPPPSVLNLSLPPSVDPVVLRAIETEPQKRFQTGAEFSQALHDALTIDNIWAEPTISEAAITTTSNANVIVRTIIPENPCALCGRENRSSSRYCRHCGHTLSDTSLMSADPYQVGYLSDIGHKAQDNEDMLLVVQGLAVNLPPPPHAFGLFAVADGVRGKHGNAAGGHEASRLAVETVADILLPLISTSATSASQTSHPSPSPSQQAARTVIRVQQNVEATLGQWLRDTMRQANQVIYHCNADYDTNMGSTLTIALLYQQHIYIANVGDTRAYYYHPQHGLRCLTKDHTLAASLVEAGLLRPEEAITSPKRHQLYRQLGQNYSITIDNYQHKVEPGASIVLCTDGLWHTLSDTRIAELLQKSEDPQHVATLLIEAANTTGGEGNVSAIVIRL